MELPDFQPWPKTPRYFREVVITEKIDGANGCIIFTEDGGLYVQSRTRFIHPDYNDNFGFSKWVHANRESLEQDLGVGRHFGEWWGGGIQRGYGLTSSERGFALFNTTKWEMAEFDTPGLSCVPILDRGDHNTDMIDKALMSLYYFGSSIVPGYRNPEGICIYHTAANQVFKVTLEGDRAPKSAAMSAESAREMAVAA